MSEIWLPIPGYEGLYSVSSEGRVLSLRYSAQGRLLAATWHGGYARVTLAAGGASKTVNVHRLMASAFLGSASGRVVRHLDGDSTNNSLGNLAYGSVAENNQDTVRHGHHRKGRNSNAAKSVCPNGHDYDELNTYTHAGARHCRACMRAAGARYRSRKRVTPDAS